MGSVFGLRSLRRLVAVGIALALAAAVLVAGPPVVNASTRPAAVKASARPAAVTTTAATEADLAITKQLSSPQMASGQPATYTVSVINLGPSVSAGPFTVTDTLPSTSTFVSAAGAGWTCVPVAPGAVGASLACTQSSDLAVGATTGALVVTVGIPATQTASVVNTVDISSTTTPDPNPANDTATVTDTPQISADLQIQKQHVGTFVAGSTGQYLFTVANHGPSDAANATITDTLPTGLTYVSATSVFGWTCSAAGQVATCTHPTSLATGSITTVTLTVQIASTVSGPIVNTATVSSTTPDPDLSNNTDSDNSSINLQADLAITKSHAGAAVAGEPFTYTLHVSNNGPSDVPGTVTVTDPMPAGMIYQSATGTGWTCSASGQLVTCTTPGPLAASTSAPDIALTVLVAPNAGPATIVNSVNVQSGIADPDLSNNHADDPTQVTVQADITHPEDARHDTNPGGGGHPGDLHPANNQHGPQRRHPGCHQRPAAERHDLRLGQRQRMDLHGPDEHCHLPTTDRARGTAGAADATDHSGRPDRPIPPVQPARRHRHAGEHRLDQHVLQRHDRRPQQSRRSGCCSSTPDPDQAAQHSHPAGGHQVHLDHDRT